MGGSKFDAPPFTGKVPDNGDGPPPHAAALATDTSSLSIHGTVMQSFPLRRRADGSKEFAVLLKGDATEGESLGRRLGPNLIRIVFEDDWADACCFLGPTDRLSVHGFRVVAVEESIDRPFDAVVNDLSRIEVVRHREISLTRENVGNFDFRLDTTARATSHAQRVVQGHNQFTRSGQYYDVVCGSGDYFKACAQFVADTLSTQQKKRILDVGCGSGLYTFFLRYYGFDVTGVDPSAVQLEIARDKRSFHASTEISSKPGPRLLLGDMARLAIHKDAPEVAEGMINDPAKIEQFECALMLGCLQLLPNLSKVRHALRRVWYHLELGGLVLCDIPNFHVVNKDDYTQSSRRVPIDAATRSLGAATLDEGTLDVVERSYVQGNYRVTEWHGFAVQSRRELRVRYFTQFDDRFDELIITASIFEEILDEEGFDVVAMYGDNDGSAYDSRTSRRRFYILRRRDIPPRPPADDVSDDELESPASGAGPGPSRH